MSAKRLVLLLLLTALTAVAQRVSQSSDPAATALASQALARLTGGLTINDVTLNGTAVQSVGGRQLTGTAVLKAKGTRESRLDLNFGTVLTTEVRTDVNGIGEGAWAGSDQVLHPVPEHNCWTDASWFFPALGSVSFVNQANAVFSYIGQETHAGVVVQHIRISRAISSNSATTTAKLQKLTTVELYLDATSLLPSAVAFVAHPDDDASRDLPVEIHFDNYQLVGGAQIPFHMQKFLNGTLQYDLTITNAILNSGLPDTIFNLQ